jgi:hypothetical protein
MLIYTRRQRVHTMHVHARTDLLSKVRPIRDKLERFMQVQRRRVRLVLV